MNLVIDNREVQVIITKKRSNKNTYLKVKEDMNIYVTTNYYTSVSNIKKLIDDNMESIIKMMNKQKHQRELENAFFYLGKKYDIVYINTKELSLGENHVLVSKNYDIDKWLVKKAKIIFKTELDKIYEIFPLEIPYPSLTIRKMKTRWGVCNVKTKRVTLNLELIRKDIKYLDYVIAHELSHLIHPNHSRDFWLLVERVIPNYKILRKELNSYE